jgi:hypothetical protein
MDVGSLESRVRLYLNEVTAKFYTQAEIWRWLSLGAKDISQRSLCVRRILTAATGGAGVRRVTVNALKFLHVEYLSTRPIMLTRIDPLKIGRYPLNGTAPQYWYEFDDGVEIDPLPDGIYPLRLYVADVSKFVAASPWADWAAGAGWVTGYSAIHSGASSDVTLTAPIVSGGNYTLEFNILDITGSVKLTAGTLEGSTITTNGNHTQNFISNGTTLKLTGTGDLTIVGFKIYLERDIASTADQIELGQEWDNLLALYATFSGLLKDKRHEPAILLSSIYANEFSYLSKYIIEVIPDGRDDLKYQ